MQFYIKTHKVIWWPRIHLPITFKRKCKIYKVCHVVTNCPGYTLRLLKYLEEKF